jgi:DNA-binding beta-propeller fold protein YncE
LYVANFDGNTVSVYAPGSTLPGIVYSQGLFNPTDVKVSLSGQVYVTNLGNNVVIYPPKSTTPIVGWQLPGLLLNSIALQTPNYAGGTDAYVSYYRGFDSSGNPLGGVMWCPTGSQTCFDTGPSESKGAQSRLW